MSEVELSLDMSGADGEVIKGLLVAPTEPTALKAMGKSAILPEKYGCDVMWMAGDQRYGIQRKELQDLKASVLDGRLGKELGQIHASQTKAVLVMEGRVSWTSEGVLIGGHGAAWTRQQLWGVQLAVQLEGVWLVQTASLGDTIAFVRSFYNWTKKKGHGSLKNRPGPGGMWGTKATDADFGRHVLTSFPGIGAEMAGQIFEEFGRVPLKWDATEAELLAIKGLGPKRVKAIMEILK